MRKIVITSFAVFILIALGVTDAMIVETDLTATLFNRKDISNKLSSSTLSFWARVENEGFTFEKTDEESILAHFFSDSDPLQAAILLKKNDRAAFLATISHPRAKAYFLALKTALLNAFSPKVHDISDKTIGDVSILSFIDPELSDEEFLFVFFGETLMEFHITHKHTNDIKNLVEILTSGI